MSQLNAQVFKTLNTIAGATSIDALKACKGKSKLFMYCGFSHKFGQYPARGKV